MSEWRCWPGSMRSVLSSLEMDLTRLSHSCQFVKVDPPVVPTVIVLVGGIFFSLGAVGRRYMYFSPLSATPESLLLFSIFCCGVS